MNAGLTIETGYYARNYVMTGKKGTQRTEKTADSFGAQLTDSAQKAQKKEYPSAVEDWKKRHPESAWQVDNQVRAGREVLRRNGAEEIDRDSMTMEEYKRFFTHLMNSIPYDVSQQKDVNVWSITEEGWEQMKNDPDYEAWVLGYTSIDRSFHNPWASWPGYAPSYHTEKFGASIDEHLGQSFAMKGPMDDEDETWWEKRHKRMKKIMKEQEEQAVKEAEIKEKMRQGNENIVISPGAAGLLNDGESPGKE